MASLPLRMLPAGFLQLSASNQKGDVKTCKVGSGPSKKSDIPVYGQQLDPGKESKASCCGTEEPDIATKSGE